MPKIVTDRGFKLVREPQVTMPEEQGAVDEMIDGKSDLAYTVALEIMPPIELADFKGIAARAGDRRGDRRRDGGGGQPHRRAEPAV